MWAYLEHKDKPDGRGSKKKWYLKKEKLGQGAWLGMGQLPVDQLINIRDLWKLRPPDRAKIVTKSQGTIEVARWTQAYNIPYRFSNTWHPALPIPDLVRPLFDWVNTTLGFGTFHQLLINFYGDGTDHLGAHSDSTEQLAPDSPIVSISFGARRTFRLHDFETNQKIRDIQLQDGQILVMGNTFQKVFKHSVVKIGGAKGKSVSSRVNITLRQFSAEALTRLSMEEKQEDEEEKEKDTNHKKRKRIEEELEKDKRLQPEDPAGGNEFGST